MGWLVAFCQCQPVLAFGVLSLGAFLLYITIEGSHDPLSQFPGPWLARFSNIYAAWHALRGDMHLDIQRCHEQYGSFVRYGPRRLLVNTSKAFDQVYGTRENLAKSKAFSTLVPWKQGETTITLLDREVHKQRRRIVRSGIYTADNHAFRAHVDIAITDFLEGFESGPVEAGILARKLTISATLQFMFGEPMALLAVQEEYFLKALDWWNSRMGLYFTLPWLPNWTFEGILDYCSIVSSKLQDFVRQRKQWGDNFTAVLQRSRESQKPTLVSCLLREGPDTLSENAFWAEAAFLFLAGSDTTATTISAALFYLLNNPRIQSSVESEVRAAFTHEDEIRKHWRKGTCPLLRACIWESLRMSPPLAAPQWREVPNHGITIDNVFVPPGCEVGASIYAVHRSEEFEHPETFDPYRWLDRSSSKSSVDVPLHPGFRPFGSGKRSCIGRLFALELIYVVIARTVFRYNLRPAERSESKEFPLKCHLTATGSGPRVRAHRAGVMERL